MELQHFDREAFLQKSWQKRPRLIRGAWNNWVNPLTPGELAGLACEPGIEARLITRIADQWAVEHGPFDEPRFATIDAVEWTLLVQAVNHHVPDVAALLGAFSFIPNWRVDDVMVSYATDGGGVGPHFDQYDVFLIQGSGKRRWQLGARCDRTTTLLPHDDLRLLDGFEAVQEWVLEPGDMLYVPPGIAHNGIAVGDDCMTYSIGFRAPSRSELIAGFAEHLSQALNNDDRYGDPALPLQDNPGEILPPALAELQRLVLETLSQPAAFAEWFGHYATSPKAPELDWTPDRPVIAADVRREAQHGTPILQNPASRFAFIRSDGAVNLFVDGRRYRCAGALAAFAARLCDGNPMTIEGAVLDTEEGLALVMDLINQGSVAFDPDA